MSRGAQLHHYPTKAALLAAAMEHLMERRHAEFRAAMGEPPVDVASALGKLWEIYSGPTFRAWLELVVAEVLEAYIDALYEV